MHTVYGNLYDLIPWGVISTARNTNGYIFTELRMAVGCDFPTDKDDLYEDFLKKCDITHTRQQHNRQELFDYYKKQIWESHNLEFWGWLFGEKYADKLVKEYMDRHHPLREDEYPFWKRPVIKCLPLTLLHWKYNPYVEQFYCLNEDLLLAHAKDCDILIVGEGLLSFQTVVMTHKPLVWKPASFAESGVTEEDVRREGAELDPAHLHEGLKPKYSSLFDLARPKKISRRYKKEDCNWDIEKPAVPLKSLDFLKDPTILNPLPMLSSN